MTTRPAPSNPKGTLPDAVGRGRALGYPSVLALGWWRLWRCQLWWPVPTGSVPVGWGAWHGIGEQEHGACLQGGWEEPWGLLGRVDLRQGAHGPWHCPRPWEGNLCF